MRGKRVVLVVALILLGIMLLVVSFGQSETSLKTTVKFDGDQFPTVQQTQPPVPQQTNSAERESPTPEPAAPVKIESEQVPPSVQQTQLPVPPHTTTPEPETPIQAEVLQGGVSFPASSSSKYSAAGENSLSSTQFLNLVEVTSVAAQMVRYERKWQMRHFAEQSIPASATATQRTDILNSEIARAEPLPKFSLTNIPALEQSGIAQGENSFGVEVLSIADPQSSDLRVCGVAAYMARQGFPVRAAVGGNENVEERRQILKQIQSVNKFPSGMLTLHDGDVSSFFSSTVFGHLASGARERRLNGLKSQLSRNGLSSAAASATQPFDGPYSTLGRGFMNKDFILHSTDNLAVEMVDKFGADLIKKPNRPKMIILSYTHIDKMNHIANKLMGPYRALFFPTFDFPFELTWNANSEQLRKVLSEQGKEGHGCVFFVLPHNTFMVRQLDKSSATVDASVEASKRHNYQRETPPSTTVSIRDVPSLMKESIDKCVKKDVPQEFSSCTDPRFPMFPTEVAKFTNGVKLAGYELKDGVHDIVGVHVRDYGSWEPYVEEAVGGAGMLQREMRQKQLRGYAHYLRSKYSKVDVITDAQIAEITPIDIPKLNPQTASNPSQKSADVEFLDIGANVGGLAFPMLSHGFRSTLFEAMPQNAQLLSTSKCLNGFREPITSSNYPCEFDPTINGDSPLGHPIRIFNKALGNAEVDIPCVAFYAIFNKGNGMIDCSAEVVAAAREGKVLERHNGLGIGGIVDISKIDKILANPILMDHVAKERLNTIADIHKLLDVPVQAAKDHPKDYFPSEFFMKDYVVKMDVEGFEAQILEGATWFLEQEFRPRAILTEIHKKTDFALRVFAAMKKYGYIGAQVVYYEGGTELVRIHPSNWITSEDDASEMVRHMRKDLTNVLWVQPEYMHLVHCMPSRKSLWSEIQLHYPCNDE